MDQLLLEKGFPLEVLENMHSEAKRTYYEDSSLMFCGAEWIWWNEGEGEIYSKVYDENRV